MLKNIKSKKYITKLLFLYIDEERKLRLVKYNKSLQKNINISIINYKHYSGRYIIYITNNYGKEYDGYNNDLLFEGEYLNGKRNGKGKEYDYDGRLIFKGEYLNGKRHGKGKEYGLEGKVSFDGEYLNGKKNGKGKRYDIVDGELYFKGEYLNDKEWIGTGYKDNGHISYKLKNSKNGSGTGVEYYHNGKKLFEGEYLNGKRNGKGIEYYNNGEKLFEGEYLNDLKWNGTGYDSLKFKRYELKNGKGLVKEYNKYADYLEFEGEYLYGPKNGRGKVFDHGILIFEGEYLNGKKNGKGKEHLFDRLFFEGEYLNDKKHGKGKEYYKNILLFEGNYLYNHRIEGKFYINGKLEYEGEYLYDKKWNGKGYDENCNIIYELINGNGKVKEY